MSYIAPNTTIYVCRGAGVDRDYTHTFYFASEAQQLAYFQTQVVATFDNYTFQRKNVNALRVEANYYSLIGCDYMFFQNTSYGDKYFYAFIDDIEYINDNTVEISYTIDAIQSWMRVMQVEKCFVLRNHTETDYALDNLQSEPNFIQGEYVQNNYDTLTDFDELGCMILAQASILGNPQLLSEVNGVFNGLGFVYADSITAVRTMTAFNNWTTGTEIYMMYTIPKQFVDFIPSAYRPASGGKLEGGTVLGATTGMDFDYGFYQSTNGLTISDSLDGYVPNNCKLYTFPYNYLEASNGMGDAIEFRYEFFLNPEMPIFYIVTQIVPPAQAMLVPTNYAGAEDVGGAKAHPVSQLTISGWPTCFFPDSHAAEGMQAIATALFSGATSAAGGALSGGMVGGATAALGGAMQVQKAVDDFMQSGTRISGGSSANIGITAKRANFVARRMSINAEMARKIDSYFDRYGYAINEFRVPNLCAREYWTYVQTQDFECGGGIPQDDKATIANAFNKGILFWNGAHADQNMNFSLDNRATQRGIKNPASTIAEVSDNGEETLSE